MSILFLYLTAFSRTGGIEKFNRAFLKALQEISLDERYELRTISLYDKVPDKRYIDQCLFRGFNRLKTRFIVESILRGLNTDLVVLGHINLAPIGLVIKQLKKNVSVVLVTHGIEVWNNLSRVKKKC
jgi:phosphatidylinositol alpha-1,6-mannosyltransferase